MASSSAEQLRQGILDSGYVLDPVGTHHELVSGMHGRKLEFGSIPTASDLFGVWVDATAEKIDELYGHEDLGNVVVLSVANGTNRLVGPVSDRLGVNYVAALTEKDTPKSVRLTRTAEYIVQRFKPGLVIALEDAGSTGLVASTAVRSSRDAGAERVEALYGWKRRRRLERLDEIDAVYNAVIDEELETLERDVCVDLGYCAMGWELIPRQIE